MKAYKEFPELARYIDRIGAEQLTFRSFMVKEYRHRSYYLEKCLVRIDAEGDITVTNKDYAPTKEEKEAVKKEFAGRTDFPKCVHASAAQLDQLIEKLTRDVAPLLFEFWDWPRKGIIMVQQRVNKADGDKMFLPWTMWSDGEWRMMEPDSGLPFWKPKRRKGEDNEGSHRIMIHEGAKTAAFVHDLISNEGRYEELMRHPYGDVLAQYEHWGMIGGALAPHRTDYTELHKEKPTEVVYVCDNDYPGNSALEKVSKHYGRALKGVQFGAGFPKSFDFADQMPALLFTGENKWKGPTWFQLLRFATHATTIVPNPAGSGRPLVTLSHDFAEEWFHVVKPEVFIHRDWPAEAFTSQEFNHRVAPFADVDDMARLMKRDGATIAGSLSYNPAEKPGLYPGADGHYINTHVPAPVKAVKADYEPFLRFMNYLIPDERERQELLKWCATLIARPDIKMLYGILLISETQGIGKSTLGEKILAPLMGKSNVSYPSESEICDSQYNYWAAHKRLAVVHEIYAGHSAKAYNKLKSIITDRTLTVSKKYMASYEIENWVHVFACSNSTRAIQLSMDDRRWFVPKVTEQKQNAEFWRELNLWLNERGGLSAIKQWAMDYVAEAGHVLTGSDAPWSITKKEMVEEGYSPGMQVVARTLTSIRNFLESDDADMVAKRQQWEQAGYIRDGAVLIVDTDFIPLIRDVVYEGRHNDKLERPLTIRKVAKGAGWTVNANMLPYKRWGDKHFRGRIITNSKAFANIKPEDVPADFKPLNLQDFKVM